MNGCPSRLARLFALVIGSMVLSMPAAAQTLAPIRYTLSFPAPHTHYVEVQAEYPSEGRSHVDLMMAVWTPGSYLIREYERHVEALTAWTPGRTQLPIEKTRKNRWRVATGGASTVVVRYRVYAHEMSVRTNWVDAEMAVLNGAPTFITLLESPSRRVHEVQVQLPRTWARSMSSLTPGGAENTYRASDYDTLVDSPIVAGTPSVYEFSVQGRLHYLVNFRERGVWNGPQAAQDLARVANAVAAFWGGLPFDRYYFFNIIGGARNGLEHKSSTMLNIPRESTSDRGSYLAWLSLASHEYFHAWNGKRLRPVELGPFDYENEVYTKALWFVEGVTDYYGDLLLARAGVATREEYLRLLSEPIRALQTTPGRLEQPVELASYDAWIKYYRPDENTSNTAINYYTKGAAIGFLLDARLRHASGGRKSLDDAMRLMYERFSGERGFTSNDLRATIAEIAGGEAASDMLAWLQRVLETTEELDYNEAIEWFGLRITAPLEAPRGWLGVGTRVENGKTLVSEVRRGSPASTVGLSLLDQIVAVNGEPVTPGQFPYLIGSFAPNAAITLSIVRNDEPRSIGVVLQPDPGHGWELAVSPLPTAAQSQHLDAWLR